MSSDGITFLHTSPVHVPTFERLMREIAPEIPVRHTVREDLLADARARGLSAEVMGAIAQSIADAGPAQGLVVCTCSTIGGAAERIGGDQGRAVIRIDRAMAERAVAQGARVAVVAALASTLGPTRELLEQVASEQGRAPALELVLCDGAWERFEQGDRDGYLGAIAATLREVAGRADLIVLAQASMADAAERCGDLGVPILSSPRLGAESAVATYRRLRAASYLGRAPFQNIMPLKHLHTYGDRIACDYIAHGDDQGVLLRIPTSVSSWDAATYPEVRMVAMLVCDTRAVGEALLSRIDPGERVLFKLIGPLEKQLVRERYAIERTTAFISYTTDRAQGYHAHPDVAVTAAPRADCLAIFASEGHDPAWLAQALAHDEALLCVKEQGGAIAAACFAARISGAIWEIGGLYTPPPLRRQGHAQHVVEAALAALAARGLVPRYQVRETNGASSRLAEKLGMRPFVVVEHFRTTGGPPSLHPRAD
jgi:GNAT superfamily N-acetyltransferase